MTPIQRIIESMGKFSPSIQQLEGLKAEAGDFHQGLFILITLHKDILKKSMSEEEFKRWAKQILGH